LRPLDAWGSCPRIGSKPWVPASAFKALSGRSVSAVVTRNQMSKCSMSKQCAVCHILRQCVFEGVFRVSRGAAPEDQLSAHQLLRRALKFLLNICATALINSCENERPGAGAICATSRVGASRSSRASSEAWSDVGIASGATGPVVIALQYRSRRHSS
jgi:hypothetical protein